MGNRGEESACSRRSLGFLLTRRLPAPEGEDPERKDARWQSFWPPSASLGSLFPQWRVPPKMLRAGGCRDRGWSRRRRTLRRLPSLGEPPGGRWADNDRCEGRCFTTLTPPPQSPSPEKGRRGGGRPHPAALLGRTSPPPPSWGCALSEERRVAWRLGTMFLQSELQDGRPSGLSPCSLSRVWRRGRGGQVYPGFRPVCRRHRHLAAREQPDRAEPRGSRGARPPGRLAATSELGAAAPLAGQTQSSPRKERLSPLSIRGEGVCCNLPRITYF